MLRITDDTHPAALHEDFRDTTLYLSSERNSYVKNSSPLNRSSWHGAEGSLTTEILKPTAKTLCIQIRKGTFNGNIMLINVYRKGNPKDQLSL